MDPEEVKKHTADDLAKHMAEALAVETRKRLAAEAAAEEAIKNAAADAARRKELETALQLAQAAAEEAIKNAAADAAKRKELETALQKAEAEKDAILIGQVAALGLDTRGTGSSVIDADGILDNCLLSCGCSASRPSASASSNIADMFAFEMPVYGCVSFVECAAALARAAAPEDDALVSETCCSLAKCIVAVCKEHDSAHSFMPEVVLNMETFISSRLSLVLQQHFQRMPFRKAPSFLNALDTQALNWVHQMTLMAGDNRKHSTDNSRTRLSRGIADCCGFFGIHCIQPVVLVETKWLSKSGSQVDPMHQALCSLSYAVRTWEAKPARRGGIFWIITLDDALIQLYGVAVLSLPVDSKGDLQRPYGFKPFISSSKNQSFKVQLKSWEFAEVYGITPLATIDWRQQDAESQLQRMFYE